MGDRLIKIGLHLIACVTIAYISITLSNTWMSGWFGGIAALVSYKLVEVLYEKIFGKKDNSKWVAIDISKDETIAEGKNPEDVHEEAKKSGKKFALMFMPDPDSTYIFKK